jgi:hypothetical protein
MGAVGEGGLSGQDTVSTHVNAFVSLLLAGSASAAAKAMHRSERDTEMAQRGYIRKHVPLYNRCVHVCHAGSLGHMVCDGQLTRDGLWVLM